VKRKGRDTNRIGKKTVLSVYLGRQAIDETGKVSNKPDLRLICPTLYLSYIPVEFTAPKSLYRSIGDGPLEGTAKNGRSRRDIKIRVMEFPSYLLDPFCPRNLHFCSKSL
jgi:hypothetical protein